MDKYLLLFGFQLTQTLTLGALNPSVWRALEEGTWLDSARGLDGEALGLVAQTLLSGTWVGRLSEIGELVGRAANGVGSLPLALLLAQWVVLVGFLMMERRVLARRLAAIERGK